MATTEQLVADSGRYRPDSMDNLWLHFSRMGAYTDSAPPVIVKGEGHGIWTCAGYSQAWSRL